MNKYIKLMRLDHWIKQLFIMPGVFIAFILVKCDISLFLFFKIILGFFSTCFIASSNYVINEWLDSKYDKYHPIKKNRVVVKNNLNVYIVYGLYIILAILGLLLSLFISFYFFVVEFLLFIMGILYNVKPFRLKDIVLIDSLSESINNALRFLMGWFIITNEYFPPISIVLGYWFSGTFLMQIKRFSEYRYINNKSLASKYRKSFKYYNQDILLISSIFYAMLSVFFVGIFLIKYKIELLFFIIFYIGLFCYYLKIAFKKNSFAQRPEMIYKEKGLMLYLLFLIILFICLMILDMPFLDIFINTDLVSM